MTIEEQVAELKRKVKELENDYRTGEITKDVYRKRSEPLVIEYLGYKWLWTINCQWYRLRKNGQWIASKSPLLVRPEDFANDPADWILDEGNDSETILRQINRLDEFSMDCD